MSGVVDFYEQILGTNKNSFRTAFESEWISHLSSFPAKYEAAIQLRIGSRFRPSLVAWGYLLAGGYFEPEPMMTLARHAVYVELLHKATLLIDDLIDDDSARHGQPAFHNEFSDCEAILFAIYLLGDCVEHLTKSASAVNAEALSKVLMLLGRAIRDMATGGIEETALSIDELSNVNKITRIIELQTIALVQNGLLVGYYFGRGAGHLIENIESLGYDAGYLFQVLNDLEPFYGSLQNDAHKGRANSDINRLRKNFVVAKFLESQSATERANLIHFISTQPENGRALIRRGLNDRRTLATLGENLRLARENINHVTSSLQLDEARKRGFLDFVDFVLARALSKLDEEARHILSDILIK